MGNNTDEVADSAERSEFRPVFENRVRFAETDLQGVVFYGEYFTFQDEAVAAFLREIDYGYDRMHEDGWDIHVVNSELNYREGAKLGDVIDNELCAPEIGTSSLTFPYRARRRADGEILADGTVTHVAVDRKTREPTRIPDAFRDAVSTFGGGLESDR
ncbi:acyl-CoA thioesterase [Natrinema gelatinilyticum]|uniref:acyl-CoA thioesterase n=1 Tax=Natrinema gelatinilyticum TaxID=2961571 RepID=UPI0020C44A38|nr:thioesterase family protein [Natrinema gelatinilyticum]